MKENSKKQKQITLYLDIEDYEKIQTLSKAKLDKVGQYVKKLVVKNILDNKDFFDCSDDSVQVKEIL